MSQRLPTRRTTTALACVLLAASGCVSAPDMHGANLATASIDPAYDPTPQTGKAANDPMLDYVRSAAEVAKQDGKLLGAAAHLSRLYDETPADRDVIFDLARHMRYIGALTEAEQVLNEGLAIHPSDSLLRLERAKVFIASGRAEQASEILETLLTELPQDPSILQALGVARDRLGEHAIAKEAYQQAMALGRPSAALLSNAAMSHLLSGDLQEAETLLRQAIVAPGATPQVRQNLALVLSLRGEIQAATQLSAETLPRPLASSSVSAYAKISTPATTTLAPPAQDPWSLAAAAR
ncbi:MAG: tetratricopeptide repeat protein [Rhodobacteraceae bacterium]|nr:tetratricopeptide repeat protein [Paracoccaceae bacterium]